MAVAVMMIGAVGIMGLQSVATRSNSFARQTTVATETTRTWLERLQRDSLMWTRSGAAGATSYLGTVPRNWFSPRPEDIRESWARSFLGMETRTAADMHYCTNVQLRWMQNSQVIRAEVRTWWHRRGRGDDGSESHARLWGNCGAGSEVEVTNELARTTRRLHVVAASTLLRWSAL